MRAPRRRVRERSRGSAKTAPTAAPAAAGAAQGTLHHPAVCVAHPPRCCEEVRDRDARVLLNPRRADVGAPTAQLNAKKVGAHGWFGRACKATSTIK